MQRQSWGGAGQWEHIQGSTGAFVVIFLATATGAWHMAYVVHLLASGNFLSS
jgi:hypothetical protein